MSEDETKAIVLGRRLSAAPWSLYQAEHLATARNSREHDGFYLSMLRDDLRKQRYAYEMSLTVDGADTQRALDALMALLDDFNHMGHDRDPAAVVCNLADALLAESLEGDEMFLELHGVGAERQRARTRRYQRKDVTDPAVSDVDAQACPSLAYVPGWSVTRRRHELLQLATQTTATAVAIPGARIRCLGMRAANRKNWRRTVRDLRKVDASKVLGSVDRYSWKGYVFADHVAAEHLAVASTTAPIGWDARGTFSESVTSPYMAFRRLRFALFWVETIEDCVRFLNQLTGDTDIFGDDAFSFFATGLPSATDLAEAMHRITDGSLSFESAHSNFLSPRFAARRSDEPGASAEHAAEDGESP